HLIRRPADALGADLDGRLDVLDGLRKDINRTQIRHAFLDLVHGAVEEAHGRGFLALPHHAVNELAGEDRVVTRVGLEGRFAGGFLAHDRNLVVGLNSATASATAAANNTAAPLAPCRPSRNTPDCPARTWGREH